MGAAGSSMGRPLFPTAPVGQERQIATTGSCRQQCLRKVIYIDQSCGLPVDYPDRPHAAQNCFGALCNMRVDFLLLSYSNGQQLSSTSRFRFHSALLLVPYHGKHGARADHRGSCDSSKHHMQYMQNENLQKQASRRRQRSKESDEDMDTDVSQSTGSGNLATLVLQGQAYAVER
ncbi:hypothetical protein UY3_04659 [Chelonia mydas]|uniref:Uncharacterized protein n=1 Tax=Chelonia mydas TaxID=8469 RepID=M7C1B2_CHEMY|nr:hypothetical protein UY3_04659 [Chelonia mydas]